MRYTQGVALCCGLIGLSARSIVESNLFAYISIFDTTSHFCTHENYYVTTPPHLLRKLALFPFTTYLACNLSVTVRPRHIGVAQNIAKRKKLRHKADNYGQRSMHSKR